MKCMSWTTSQTYIVGDQEKNPIKIEYLLENSVLSSRLQKKTKTLGDMLSDFW